MVEPAYYTRHSEQLLIEALDDSPAVLIHGPRQSGKTTLAQTVGGRRGYEYISFDNSVPRRGAQEDPVGFVDELPDRVILDEVQHVPELFGALKSAIDRARKPGRFILTGSTNILLLPRLADSLAGRMEVLRLHPLAQCELVGRRPDFIDRLFEANFGIHRFERMADSLIERVVAGGYPAALARPSGRRRTNWYRDYLDALVQRDVRDLTRIRSLDVLPRLLTAIAGETGRLLNIADLASPFQLSRPTIRDYVTLLSRVFLVDEQPPWHSNKLSRLIKSHKIHIGDTGLGCALIGADVAALKRDRALLGRMLETFVFQELRRHASWHERALALHHYRDRDGVEVDIVVDGGALGVAGVEVKAAASVVGKDFRGLRKLRDAAGKRFRCGVVVYDGEFSSGFGDGLYAVPIRSIWEGT